jgi:hypothetical protein
MIARNSMTGIAFRPYGGGRQTVRVVAGAPLRARARHSWPAGHSGAFSVRSHWRTHVPPAAPEGH